MQEDIELDDYFLDFTAESATMISASLAAGYVIWALRSGVFLASFLQLPLHEKEVGLSRIISVLEMEGMQL